MKAPADPPGRRRDWFRQSPTSPRPIAAPELRQQLTPAQPADDFTRDYLNMQRDLATIHEPPPGFQQSTQSQQTSQKTRGLSPCSIKLLTAENYCRMAKIRYDNRDFTPQQWEKERFKQAN